MGKVNSVLNILVKIKNLIKMEKIFSKFSNNYLKNNTTLDLSGEYNKHLITFLDPRSPIIEQYRSLRTHLLGEAESKSIDTFLVTSSVRDEGKSTTACNLAIILARNRQNSVLLVDGDMRAPSVHKMFGIKANRGFVDYLKDEAELESLIVPTEIDNLFLLPAGEPHLSPSELLTKSKITDLLKRKNLEGEKRYIIIDSPPVIPTTDTRILANYVGGVLFVVQAGKTPKDVISHGISLLKKTNIIGVVLNNISGISLYYPYRYSYAYGYGEYEK